MAKPSNCISVEEAKALQSNWLTTRASAINISVGFQDCYEFVYSVDELQEYLDYVKEVSETQNIPNPGLRIYFGAYNDVNSVKATVFIAPTMGAESNSENNYEIEPFNNGVGGWPPHQY